MAAVAGATAEVVAAGATADDVKRPARVMDNASPRAVAKDGMARTGGTHDSARDAVACDPVSRDGVSRDTGSSTVELALLMPIVLAVLLLVVQLALVFHARQIADGAARVGARVARAAGVGDSSGNWQAEAETQAQARIALIGKKVLENASVQAWQEGDQRGVTVTGNVTAAIPLLPGMNFTISARSGGPIECFRPDDGTGDCQ